MNKEASLVFKAFRAYLVFILSLVIALLPLIVGVLVDYYLHGAPAGNNQSYLSQVALYVLRCNPLIWLLSKYTGYSFSDPMSAWDWKQNICVLLLLLPSSAILSVILSKIIYAAKNLGRHSFSLLTVNRETGKMEATALAGGICISVESGWNALACGLVERLYDQRRPILFAIIAVILVCWIGFELSARFRGRSMIISALVDLMDSLFELPVMASLSALLWWCLTFLGEEPVKALLCLVGTFLIMLIYSRFSEGKLTKNGVSVPLYYGLQVFFLVCLVIWWRKYMA